MITFVRILYFDFRHKMKYLNYETQKLKNALLRSYFLHDINTTIKFSLLLWLKCITLYKHHADGSVSKQHNFYEIISQQSSKITYSKLYHPFYLYLSCEFSKKYKHHSKIITLKSYYICWTYSLI